MKYIPSVLLVIIGCFAIGIGIAIARAESLSMEKVSPTTDLPKTMGTLYDTELSDIKPLSRSAVFAGKLTVGPVEINDATRFNAILVQASGKRSLVISGEETPIELFRVDADGNVFIKGKPASNFDNDETRKAMMEIVEVLKRGCEK